MKETNPPSQEELDEQVYYCKSCHSLYVLFDQAYAYDGWDGSYCGKCQSADIGVTTMREWLEEEEKRAERKRIREWSK